VIVNIKSNIDEMARGGTKIFSLGDQG